MEQLGVCTTANEPALPRVCALQQEATTIQSPNTSAREQPLLCATRDNPRTAMNTQPNQK